MIVLSTIQEIHEWSAVQRAAGHSVGFVPTMGYLHEGHISLINAAKHNNDVVLASIFVNPTQFAAGEDLSRYPRDFERDCSMLSANGCTALFAPTVDTMYPPGFSTTVHVDGVTSEFEGLVRPSHFDGVALVVTRLLCLTTPTGLYLGQKDLQQTAVLRRLVLDLGLNTTVHIVPTVRDADGLAKSSRNVYLSPSERSKALVLSRALRHVTREALNGTSESSRLLQTALAVLHSEPDVLIDYIAIVDPVSMKSISNISHSSESACIIAARVGSTRLIDNCFILQGL